MPAWSRNTSQDGISASLDLLFIENVGNLVCPTSYDLGEDAKVVVLSVAEGEDKPLKYPGIFRKAELMILNKIDLLPYVPFKPELAREYARRIHPEIEIIETSATTGAGFDQWLDWLISRAEKKQASAAPRAEAMQASDKEVEMLAPRSRISVRRSRRRGITRRQLVKFCSVTLATLAMPERYLAQTVAAISKARKPVLVWLQFQDCTGCSESMLRSSHPEVADVVLDLLSWEYHEVIMAGAGDAANHALDRVVKEEKGKYLVVVEGAIPMADGGVYCTIGGRTRDRHRPPGLRQRRRHHRGRRLRLRRRTGALQRRIPPARWACTRPSLASRSSTWQAARTTPPIPPPCWCTT